MSALSFFFFWSSAVEITYLGLAAFTYMRLSYVVWSTGVGQWVKLSEPLQRARAVLQECGTVRVGGCTSSTGRVVVSNKLTLIREMEEIKSPDWFLLTCFFLTTPVSEMMLVIAEKIAHAHTPTHNTPTPTLLVKEPGSRLVMILLTPIGISRAIFESKT